MNFSLLALDCDGVIVDSMDVKTEAMRRVGEAFGRELCDRLVMFHQIEGGISRFEKFRWLIREAYGREITDAEMADLSARFVSALDNALEHCAFVPGLEDLLEDWHARVPIVVCSGAPQQELEALLRAKGIARYFTRIGGYPPAKTTLLGDILRETGVAGASAVMVGDTITDARAAEENGTLFYGIGDMFAEAPCPHGRDLYACNAWLHTL